MSSTRNQTRDVNIHVLHLAKNVCTGIYVLCLYIKHNVCIYKHDVYNLIQNIIYHCVVFFFHLLYHIQTVFDFQTRSV